MTKDEARAKIEALKGRISALEDPLLAARAEIRSRWEEHVALAKKSNARGAPTQETLEALKELKSHIDVLVEANLPAEEAIAAMRREHVPLERYHAIVTPEDLEHVRNAHARIQVWVWPTEAAA